MALAEPVAARLSSAVEMPAASNTAQPFLHASHISKAFGASPVLKDASLSVYRGELIAILGPSGCGKTTLLRIIAGLEKQDAGQVFIDQRDVSVAPPAQRRCGIVFQSYALFPNLTVAANIAFGMNRRMSRAQRRQRVVELLQLIGLPEIASRHPSKLSGGQQQRVALARALAVDPALLLLDEPLSALDAKVRVRLRGEIRQIQQRLGLTTILVTHDQEEALTMADRVVVMDHGVILQIGTPWEIYHQPNQTLVADFVGAMNLLSDWRIEAGDRLVHQQYQLHLSDPCNVMGANLCVMFRPEHAELVPAMRSREHNCLPGQVQRMEFRGPVTRVYVSVLGQSVVVDAPFQQVSAYLHADQAQVHVHIPPEHLRVFRKDGSAL